MADKQTLVTIKLRLYYIVQAAIAVFGNSPELEAMASRLEKELLAE